MSALNKNVLVLLLASLAGCGQQLVEFGGNPAGGAPSVTSTSPADTAIDVATDKIITANFSEAMDPSTIQSATFKPMQGTTPVAGAVTYAGTTATFTPASILAEDTVYSATITIAAKNLAGTALAAAYTWSFKTGKGGGAKTPPTVTSTNPADGSTARCIPFKIDAFFDKSMNRATLGSSSFTLSSPGPTAVKGAVTYDPATRSVSFEPAVQLPATNTTYTATITTGAQDETGNALAASKVWTFSTSNKACVLPVNLRSLAKFVAVAGAGLTNSNTQLPAVTTLNGDVGLAPTATCMSDGVVCNPAGGAPRINGTLYANDPAGKAATAKADLVAAYNDAQGRPKDVTVVGNLAGQILAPGVYWSGSTMDIAVNGTLTLDAQGDSNGIWIFQLGSALTANTGSKVVLINGAKAANVFWAIGSSSTLGSNVDFKGTVLAVESNSVGTGSTVEGRLVCTTGAITLLSNVITLPAP
jgi:hypothetical protein